MTPLLPFRLGTTSYIWPDDILPNVRQLAPLVDDIELVLFESDEYGSNLPDKDVIAELKQLALAYGLTYPTAFSKVQVIDEFTRSAGTDSTPTSPAP